MKGKVIPKKGNAKECSLPYNYTVEVTNRFKELDLIECLKNYEWRFVTCTRVTDQNYPQEKEMQKSKMIV